MFELEDLAAASTGTVTLRGKARQVRSLNDLEEQWIAAAFEAPRAPLIPDPTKGSLAPAIRDEQDPAYRDATREWNKNTRAALAAVALDLKLELFGGAWSTQVRHQPEKRRAWLIAAAQKMRETFSADELIAVERAVQHLDLESLKAAEDPAAP